MAINLTDENFESEIQKAGIPALVDFYAEWCQPCGMLAPILEELANDFGGRIVLMKANLDQTPLAAQRFKIEQIPTVVLFKEGKPISGFLGVRPKELIKEWLEKMLEGNSEAEDFIQKSQKYAQENGFKLNPDKDALEKIVRGLLENEKKYGKKYCPCRRVSGVEEEDSDKVCPCRFHKEEIEKDGNCFCRLYFKN